MSPKKEAAIKLTNVSKKYYIHHEKPTLTERVLRGKGEEFYALKNINLEIKKGEKIGIIGPNGSGKTTLLKLITGITTPTSGSVETLGKVVSLIDLEAGFHPDLTGIQNIYLNGTILGMKNADIKSKLNEIISFAGIGKFIDAPLFTYSEGMKLRIGFSVAIHANPDIFIVDENLTVGDQEFRNKSFSVIKKFADMGKTFVVASHEMWFIREFCSRVIYLENGKLVSDGKANNVLLKYEKYSRN